MRIVSLPAWRYRQVARLIVRRGYAVFYGRRLYLPPSTLPARAYPREHPLVAGLEPFRRRLHRQRATVTVLRALILAALAATLTLLLRAFGYALPLPLAPLLAAGAVLLLCLAAIAGQRPSPPEMSHALDRGLDLHEQIGSALDVEQNQGRLADLLRQRASTTLHEANPAFVLPWPSLQRERRTLLGMALVVAVCALVAAHAPLAHPHLAASPVPSAAQHHGHTTDALRPGATPIKLWAIGAATQTRPAASSYGRHGAAGAHLGGAASGRHDATGRHVLVGKGTALQTGQAGQGTHGAAPGKGGRAGQGANGGPTGQTGTLHLRTGQNSTAGGVSSPQQQALQNLRSSIASASTQRPPQGQSRTAAGLNQNTRNGARSRQGGTSSASGRNQHGHSRAGAAGQRHSGGNGARTGQGSNGRGASSSANNSSLRARGAGTNDPSLREGLHRGAGFGSDSGAASHSPTQGSAVGHAQAGNSGAITLNGANGNAGQLTLSVGLPNRAPGLAGNATSGAPNTPLMEIPGYVAPDSNAVTPDDRAVVRGYFSPPPGGN